MSELLHDIRYGLRMIWTNRIVSLAALLSIALGIGATSAIFSVISALLLRPLPYQDPQNLVVVWENRPLQGVTENVISPADFKDWKEQNQAFEQLAAYEVSTFSIGDIDFATQVYGANVSANFFNLLGVKPVLGRTFHAEEETPGKNRVVLMSHSVWRQRFGEDPGIVNRQIRLNDESYLVIGVLPPEFEFTDRDLVLWTPLALAPEDLANRGLHYLQVVGRLKPGVTLAQARGQMDNLAAQLAQTYPEQNQGHGVNLVPLDKQLTKTIGTALIILQVVVLFVLLIACANVANLLLSIAVKRQKESAIRTALGASRFRIIRQYLTESVLLSLMGGLLGLVLAFLLIRVITRLIPSVTSVTIFGWDKIAIDLRVVLFTFGVAVLTGIVFGTAPALRASDINLTEELKEGSKGSSGGARKFLRNSLVVVEVALALVLLIGAGLMLKSFQRLQDVNPGFNPQNVLTMEVPVSTVRYPTPAQRVMLMQQISQRLQALPGVEAVAAVFSLPLGGQRASRSFTVDGAPPPAAGTQDPRASYNAVSPNYFRAMNIAMLKGRDFAEHDLAGPPQFVIVNSTMAQRVWPNEDPIGKRFKIGGPKSTNPWLSVIGVVADSTQTGVDIAVKPEIYVPLTQTPVPTVYLVVKTSSAPGAISSEVRRVIHDVDKTQPVGEIRMMEQVVSESIAQPRLYAVLIACFATLALVLSIVGIYSMMAYSVTQRTREVGIRMALGATRGDIMKLILKQGLLLTLIGGAIGLMGAYAATRVVSTFLFGISAKDPRTFVEVSVLLLIVALVAIYFPARKATRVEPVHALRQE